MEILVILYMLLQLLGQSSELNASDGESDLVVKKFSWRHYGKVEPEAQGNSNTRRKTAQRVYMEEMYNRNSIENRSRDMLELEESVRRESMRSRYPESYGYKVEVRNTGHREVRAVFWAYTVTNSSGREESSQRQFRCVVKIKPNSGKQLEGFSSLPPSQVVSAEGGSFTEKVVINRVEYSGGDIWQRPDWQLPDKQATKSKRHLCESL